MSGKANTAETSVTTTTTKPPAEKPTGRFDCQHSELGFDGELLGIEFEAGKANTDDPVRAHALLEHGVKVTDRRTNMPAFTQASDDELLKQHRAAAKK